MRGPKDEKDTPLDTRKRKNSRQSDEPSYSSDESEGSESQNEYQKDDFLVSDEDDEGSEQMEEKQSDGDEYRPDADGSDEEGRPGRRRRRRDDSPIRPQRRLKRIKKLQADHSEDGAKDEEQEPDDEDDFQASMRAARRRRMEPKDEESPADGDEEEEDLDDTPLYYNKQPGVLNRVFDEEKIEYEERRRREEQEQMRLQNRTMHHLFEPADLIRHYETPEDKLVADTDVPERLQLLNRHREDPTQAELTEEAEWMLKQLSSHRGLSEKEEERLDQRLLILLQLMRLNHFEVMYIWMYKQQDFSLDIRKHPGAYQLKLADLWFVYEMDQEWRTIWAKKDIIEKLFSLLQNHQHISEQVQAFKRQALTSRQLDWLIDWAQYQNRKVYTLEELRASFELMNLKGRAATMYGNKTTSYEMSQRGLTLAAESFSLTADQLAQNLLDNQRTHKVPLLKELPVDLSRRCIKPDVPLFKESTSVFQELLNYLAQEYVTHPIIRKVLFQELRAIVTLNTEPMERGRSLTVYDYFFPAKRVSYKKIDNNIHNLWLLATEAEKKGLVKIVFKYEGVAHGAPKLAVRQKLASHLLTPKEPGMETDKATDQWNKVRENLIARLIDNYLIPEFEASFRHDLTEAAEKYVYNRCSQTLKEVIYTKPYRIKDPNSAPTEPKSVLACANDDLNSIFVVIKETGEVQDFVELMNLLRRPAEGNFTQQNLFRQDLQKLRDFVDKNRPEVIVVAPKNLKSHNLKMELFNIADNVAKGSGERVPFVMWGNFHISSAFAKSALSNDLLPGYSMLLKEAVSTGRFIQNPIAETLNLWSENEKNNVLLQLSLHRFQHLVNPYKLKNRLENLLVELVNSIGVDIRACVTSKHLAKQLQFVCGLGPRKATKILEKVRRLAEEASEDTVNDPHGFEAGLGFLSKRTFLGQFNLVGPIVMLNAIGFIRVFGKRDFRRYPDASEEFEWLDFTRIHPDEYPMAKKISTSVLEVSHQSENANVLQVLKQPSQLDGYNLEDYGQHLSNLLGINMVAMVDFIVKELKDPFGDDRPDFPTRLENQEIFYRLSGESKYSFLEGAIITAKIIGVNERGLKVLTTGSELLGNVKLNDPRDDPVPDAKANYIVGNHIRVKINRINYGELNIDLSIRPRDLSSHSEFLRQNHVLDFYELSDGHGFKLVKEEDFPRNLLETRSAGKSFQSRKISHPYFKNIGLEKAQEFLADRTRGEFLFRPSSKGPSYINITWKMFEDFFVHLLIREGPKLPNEEVSRKLELLKKEYDSLDSIISNYLRPCNKIVDNILVHDKFSADGVDKTKALMLELKASKPQLIPYNFTIAKEYPGFLVLCYAASRDQVKYEVVQVKPDGLGFHQQVFANLDYLIKFFKDNVKKKEYQKYVESLPKVEFGYKDREKKEEVKGESYVKSEDRRRTYRDVPIVKREYPGEHRVKQEYADPYPRGRGDYSGSRRSGSQGYGGPAVPRRKGSDDSLEYDRYSPSRNVKREEPYPPAKMEAEHPQDPYYSRYGRPPMPPSQPPAQQYPPQGQQKRHTINFEAA